MNVYDRFTDRARGVVILADLACRQLGQHEVGTEHLLIGVAQEVGTAHHVLRAMGIDPDGVRATVAALFGTDEPAPADQPVPDAEPVPAAELRYATEARVALETALREAIGMRHDHVGTEHILLGLLRNNDARGVRVLLNLRVDPDAVRERVFDLVSSPGFVSPELATRDASAHAIVSTGSGPSPAQQVVAGVDVRALADEVARLRTELYELRAKIERLEQP